MAPDPVPNSLPLSPQPAVSRPAISAASPSPRHRLLCALTSLCLLTWLLVAASLTPDPSGLGTHRQLGLAPCGWIIAFGKPCPTCGMTTSFSNAAQGHFWASLRGQPFATLLALGVATGFWASGYAALTGLAMGKVYAFLLRPRWVWAMLALLALSWGYKLAVAAGRPA